APEEMINYVVSFLQRAHLEDEPYSIRDGINITRLMLKIAYQKYNFSEKTILSFNEKQIKEILYLAVQQILGDESLRYLDSI
ncbi:MAG: MoxR family ATPase, partial [bacterium]